MEVAMSQIIPDFVVEAHNGELILSMNNRGVPDMRINREYAEMFQDYTANKANQTAERRDAVQFVKQKLDSAQWFIELSSNVMRPCSVPWRRLSIYNGTFS